MTMPPPFSPNADLLAQWTPAHEGDFRWLRVTVIEQLPAPVAPLSTPPVAYYRVQTNMGVTMVLPETDLTDFPASTTMPVENEFAEP